MAYFVLKAFSEPDLAMYFHHKENNGNLSIDLPNF